QSNIGPAFGKWWQSAGKAGVKPEGDILKQLELLEQGKGVPAEQRVEIGKQILQLYVENCWVIALSGLTPSVAVVSNKLGNVPELCVMSTPAQTAGNVRPEQFYFKA